MPNYPKEQLWDLYENLPKEIQEAVFSSENAETIYSICTRNEIADENKISEIAKNICYVLLGLLKPDELQSVLEKEIKLKQSTAKQVLLEITKLIFFPIKASLEKLYEIEIAPVLKPTIPASLAENLPKGKIPSNAKKRKTNKKTGDRYREPTE